MKLLNCPFCGAPEKDEDRVYLEYDEDHNSNSGRIRCHSCFAKGPERCAEEDAVEEWNKRRLPPAAQGLIDAAIDMRHSGYGDPGPEDAFCDAVDLYERTLQ